MKPAMIVLLSLALCCAASSVAGPSRAPISVVGKTFSTSLDSEAARYYAHEYLQGRRTNAALDAQLDALGQRFKGRAPSRDELTELTRRYSPDFATLFYMQQMASTTENAPLQTRFAGFVKEHSVPGAALPSSKLIVLFAPAWFYKTREVDAQGDNRANFKRSLDLLTRAGIEAHLIPSGEHASVEQNAKLIADVVRKGRADGKRYVLVSASKSGPEVALALGSELRADEASHVVAWLNIGGVLGGTPLADDVLGGVKCSAVQGFFWFKGWPMDGLLSMGTPQRREKLAKLHIPAHINVLNYVPAPMSADVTKEGRDGYESLKTIGPNDGLVLLTDEVMPGGRTIMEPGLDHFLRTEDIDARTLALVRIIDEEARIR